MDTLTHALLGGLVVRASLPRSNREGAVPGGVATLAGVLAAAFPDLDYLSFWIDPLAFLAHWHRGPTHSLLMAPFWALLLGLLFARLFRRPRQWRLFTGISLLALLSHIASDLITAYGTQLLWPLSERRTAFGTTFVVDPYFTALILVGLGFSLRFSHPASSARLAVLILGGYVGFQLHLQHQAEALGEAFRQRQGLMRSAVHALPQPLSPFNWSIIVSDGHHHQVGRVNLAYLEQSQWLADRLGWLGRLWAAYRPPDALAWEDRSLFPAGRQELAGEVWAQPRMADFRDFARFPVLYRIDGNGSGTCVWFTDLRYVLPGLTPPFRYGMCRDEGDAAWALYRLRRFTHDERHYLGET